MTDGEVISYLWPNKISLMNRYIKNNKDISKYINYLNNRYNDSESIEESLYRIKYNIENRPLCAKCHKKIKFNKNHFNKYCSHSCSINQDAIRKSIKEKYNIDNVSQLDFVKEKIKKNNLIKYGVENTFNLSYSIQKSKDTRKKNKKEWLEKIQKTNIKKYGVNNPAKAKIIKEKIQNTNLKKYGTKFPIQSDLVKKKYNWTEIIEKINNTKKINKSFNISKPENESYNLLKEKYSDIIQQYRSDSYPYACDFYIPSLDLYIECNYHWTHGGKIYEGTIEDNIKLEKWKSKNTKYYKNAINTWTNLDIRKYNTAKENKLNYFLFYNINELKNWLLKNEI